MLDQPNAITPRPSRRALLIGGAGIGVAAAGGALGIHWKQTLAHQQVAPSPRTSLSLDGAWSFRPGATPDGPAPAPAAGGWRTVSTPGYLSPAYLDRYHRPWATFPFTGELANGWYQRDFVAPAAFHGQVTHLRFGAVASSAEVWLNGRRLGTHVGAYSPFSFDVSDQLRLGQSNTLSVRVESAEALKANAHANVYTVPTGMHRDTVGIWQSVTLEAVAPVNVQDVFVKPTTDSLVVTYTLANDGRASVKGVTVTVEVFDDAGQPFAHAVTPAVDLAPGERRALTTRFDNVRPKLWEPGSPALYRLRLSALASGAVVDMTETRFGFRTFAVKGDRFYLNGRPFFLRGANHPPHIFIQNDKAAALRYLQLLKDANVVITRFHMEPPSPDWLDAADELGLLVILEGPVAFADYPWTDAAFIAQVQAEYRELLPALRNHPSIVIWSLGNEMMADKSAPAHAAMRPVLDLVRTLDPTRPILGDAGQPFTGFDGFGDIEDYHDYSGWYANTLKNIQGWRTGEASTAKGSVPFTLTEFLGAYTRMDTGAFYDDIKQRTAGLMRIGATGDTTNRALWYQGFALKELTETLRRARQPDTRVAGLLPFTNFDFFLDRLDGKTPPTPKPAYGALGKAMQPVMVSVELWDRHAYAGTTINPAVYVINDSLDGRAIRAASVRYQLTTPDGGVVLQGVQPVGDVPYYRSLPVPLPLALPDLLPRNTYTLTAQLVSAAKVIAENTLDLTLAPRDWVKPRVPGAYPALLDPAGTTDKALSALGTPFTRIANLEGLQQFPGVVIGRNALAALAAVGASVAERLDAYTQAGGRVLVLEQDKLDPSWLGAPGRPQFMDPAPAGKGGLQPVDSLDVIDAGHPVFRGLVEADFRMWNLLRDDQNMVTNGFKENSQAKVLLSTYVLIESDAVKVASDRAPVLVRIANGKGRYYLNQALITERAAHDPIAGRLLANLVTRISRQGQLR